MYIINPMAELMGAISPGTTILDVYLFLEACCDAAAAPVHLSLIHSFNTSFYQYLPQFCTIHIIQQVATSYFGARLVENHFSLTGLANTLSLLHQRERARMTQAGVDGPA